MTSSPRKATALLVVSIAALIVLTPAASGRSPVPRPLLPNLVPFAPAELFGPQTGVVPSFGYGYPVPPIALSGCLVDEIARRGVSRCLRFETVVANFGKGHLEIVFRAETPQPGAYQVVYRDDGTSRARFVAASEYHPTHTHFHLTGFYDARLWRARAGTAVGVKPIAHGDKSGFCPEDGARERGGGEARYSCLGDYRPEGLTAGQVVGISAGWSDAYRMHLPDQFIDVEGVEDGVYLLEIRIDPRDEIAESNESDNNVCVLIELVGDDATIARPRAACPAAH